MSGRKRPRKGSGRSGPPAGERSSTAPRPTEDAAKDEAEDRSIWQRATSFLTSVRGIVGTVAAIVVAVASILKFFQGDFEPRLITERTRLFAAGSSLEDRLDAVRTLSELPGKRQEYERVSSILETVLTVRASVGEQEPCSEASESDPLLVQRTLLALSSVNARAERQLVLAHADLRNLRGDSIVLDGARITQSCLTNAQLNGARLRRADLSGSDLSGAQLEGARLDSARLRYVNFASANLNNATLNDADLLGAVLRAASAVNADFTLADLTNTRLDSVDVSFACMSGASLAGADLRGIRYWEELRSLSRAYVGHVANAPDGLVPFARAQGGVVTSLTTDSLMALRQRARAAWSASPDPTVCVRD
jgi:uncharacterized protein YjbI with pentapeptide repeats